MDFSIKTYIGIGSLILLTSLNATASQIFYAPALCEPEELTLFVKNKSAEPQRLWAQLHYGDELDEINYDVDAKSEMKIRGTQFLPTKMAFSLKTWEKETLQITAVCKTGLKTVLTSQTSPVATHYVPSKATAVQLHVLNLYLKKQSIQLVAYASSGAIVGRKEILLEKYYDTNQMKWTLPENTARLEVRGEQRLHSLVHFDTATDYQQSPALPTVVSQKVDPSKSYFLVSTRDAKPEEGFVIALDQADLIATAREQVKNKELHKIIVAGIELGNAGYNRAMLAKDKAPYSWSVNRVDAFADFAHIDCDGSPDIVEERLGQRLNEGGRICFWRYRIVRELTAAEVNSGNLRP